MADGDGAYSFFQDFHVRIDTIIDISIYIRPTSTKFGKNVNLLDMTQMRLIKQVLVTSLP